MPPRRPHPPEPPDPADDGLPRRPRARSDVALLWRDERVLQVGTGPDAVVLADVDRGLVAWAVSLDGLLPIPVALDTAEAAGHRRGAARRLLRVLTATGAVEDAVVTSAALRLADPATRHRLMPDFAAAAHVHGSTAAAAAAFDRRAAAAVRVVGIGRTADAVRAALAGAGLGRILEATQEPETVADITVVADDHHPEVLEDPAPHARGEPSLPVAVHGRRALVGPLVVAGVSACLACEDLHRRDRDPAWPRLAVQLAHRRPRVAPVDTTLATLAASLVVLQVVAVVEAGDPYDVALPTRDAAVELTLPGGRWRSLARHPHPLCGCRWQARYA